MQAIHVEVYYDFICPWCWIGQQNFAATLAQADASAPLPICFVPFELNPAMPSEGLDRRAYCDHKLDSWARSLTMDAQVTAAGLAAGEQFNYQVQHTPTRGSRIA